MVSVGGQLETAGEGGEPVQILLVTAPDATVGASLARSLVGARLAACVNLLPGVTSIYRWQGAVEEATEVLLLVKTRKSLVPEVAALLAREHPYECPELIALDAAAGLAAYLGWVREETR
jgi:periplasmic divalent cation tolerance protein